MQKVKSFLKSWEFFLILLLIAMCVVFKITDASRIAAGAQKKPIFFFANVMRSMRPYFLYSFMTLGMNKINPTQLTQGFKDSLINHSSLGLPFLVWLAVLVVVVTGVFLKYTRTGRNLYAVGSNAEAAQMRGVPINRIRVLAHTICGATAGLAGIMWLAYYAAIEKSSALGNEMFTIAACVLGGVAVTGGYGKMSGVVIGAVMIAFIDNAIPQMGIGNSMITEFIKGILLLLAILLNVILQRIAEKQDLTRRNI